MAHVAGQLHVVGEDDLAGRLQQADVAVGRHRIGPLVVGHGVGEQGSRSLGELDVAGGDDEPQLLLVAHLVGLEQNGFLAGRGGLVLGVGARRRRREAEENQQ